MCCSSINQSFTANYLDAVWEWRDQADGCCDHFSRRFVTELAIVTAIPIVLIELTARAVFHILNALVVSAFLPCCCCFKVPMLPCKILGDALFLLPQIPFYLIFQPIMPTDI